MKYVIPLLLGALLPLCAASQTTLQVVTKTVVKNVGWKPGYQLEIVGENAEVIVRPGTGTGIRVQAELSARHPALDTAKLDLEAWKLVVSTLGKKVYVRAYVGVAAGKPTPTSNMKAKIIIQAPAACPVSLSNKYGKAHLESLEGPVALRGEFCSFTLTALNGPVSLDTQYGDVEASNMNGKLDIQSKRADVSVSELRADCAVRSEYGHVRLTPGAHSGNIWVKGSKSDVTVELPIPVHHNVYLTAEYGKLYAPDTFQRQKADDHTQQAVLKPQAARAILTIETALGNITIQ